VNLLFGALITLAAVTAAVIKWGIRIFLGASATALLVLISAGIAWQVRRARRCGPCRGKPGICTCKSKARCSHPLCGAADTGVMTIDDEYRALLDREGGRG
jgi:hypothetical protein